MNIFDFLKINTKGNNLEFNEWVEWTHYSIPNSPLWFREIVRHLILVFGHCLNCSALSGCYFVSANMPSYPLHENCDCGKLVIDFSKVKNNAKAKCDIRKFTEYIFKDTQSSKGKNKIFYDLGYNINDSEFLREEYCKQALNQYLVGNYKLKTLDQRGQRLAIPIKLGNKNFYSGWMLYPDGEIQNNTPFGGWLNE